MVYSNETTRRYIPEGSNFRFYPSPLFSPVNIIPPFHVQSSGSWTKGPSEAQFLRDIVSPYHIYVCVKFAYSVAHGNVPSIYYAKLRVHSPVLVILSIQSEKIVEKYANL
jgi:hypothetical protein